MHLLVKLAVNSTKHFLETGSGNVFSQPSGKRQLEPSSILQVPLIDEAQESLQRRFSLLFGCVRHHHQEFISTLPEYQVAAAEYFFHDARKIGKHAIAFHAAQLRIQLAEAVDIHNQESQCSAVAVGPRYLMRNQFVQGAPVEQLGKRINQ